MSQAKMMSASEISRLVQRPLSKVLKAVRSGAISPDCIAMDGRLFLFSADRYEAIKQQIEKL